MASYINFFFAKFALSYKRYKPGVVTGKLVALSVDAVSIVTTEVGEIVVVDIWLVEPVLSGRDTVVDSRGEVLLTVVYVIVVVGSSENHNT